MDGNWRSPRVNKWAGGKVHRVSEFELNDGTALTVCGSRIGSRWEQTDAEVDCNVCLNLIRIPANV